LLLLVVTAFTIMQPHTVKAEEAEVTFGSVYYEHKAGDTFPIGIYINTTDTAIGDYHVEIKYDNRRLTYVGGGDSEQDGVVTLEGTGSGRQVKYMVQFKAVSGGTAMLEVQRADVEGFDVTDLNSAPVYLEGDDTVGEITEEDTDTEAEEVSFTDIPLAGEVVIEDVTYYMVDHALYVPDTVDWAYDTVAGVCREQSVTFLTNRDKNVHLLFLMDRQENLYLYAYSGDNDTLYPCSTNTINGEKYYFMSPYACKNWPDELSLDVIASESIVYGMDLYGTCDFYKPGDGNKMVLWDEGEGEASIYQQTIKLLLILCAALFIILVAVAFSVQLDGKRHRTSRHAGKKKADKKQDMVEDLDLEVAQNTATAAADTAKKDESAKKAETAKKDEPVKKAETAKKAEPAKEDRGEPVISVQNVTMRFRVSMNNVSGIKEYVIQLVKKQISYRELLALSNVSFDIYRGEVVGIIGTNGSGKSTMLKIVSGALKPTSGKVVADRNKIQLLTLGTGFDMELTAKENVYLNGAIIGYSKEFIDEKYDEIVQFAELEGFMEEKVKNFSSGMVSRLGFAIATVGDVAEILILDEVLSVGDEFFRKKSLKRVKEMIHSGATVLLVSHSMGTILENCTKVVWLEKGVLQMVGEPKEVCAAYRKLKE
jgi:ABC-2 type transport system ATP-binding protein